jgi:tRNA-dihydrouridine synthase B
VDGEAPPPRPALGERVDTAVAQFGAGRAVQRRKKIACLEARKHFAWYLKGRRPRDIQGKKSPGLKPMDDIYRVADTIKRELR